MAAHKVLGGIAGKIIVPGSTVQSALLNKWSMTAARTIHDTSTYDSSLNTRTRMGGMTVYTGTASGFADAATTPILTGLIVVDQPGTSGWSLVLRDGATDQSYTFSAIVTDLAVETSKQGMALISFSFTATGAVGITDFVA